jgi:hypothetical protein
MSTLNKMYCKDLKSIRQIASELDCDYATVRYYLKKYEIPTRSYSQAEIVFREKRSELYENRLKRIREALGVRSRTQFPGKQETFRILRSAIRPFVTLYREEHPKCERCDTNEAIAVHHLESLNDLVCEMVESGVNLNRVVYEVTKKHYTGSIQVVSVCSGCHRTYHSRQFRGKVK